MKCAFELAVMAMENEKQKKEREQEQVRKNTIELCEEIGNKLEKMAENGRFPSYEFKLGYNYAPLIDTTGRYADGRKSYEVRADKRIDIELFKEWFAQYCFEVKIYDFEYWRYWCGKEHGYSITIKPSPECLK